MHIQEAPGPSKEIRLLFLTLKKLMKKIEPELFEEALLTYDLKVTWDNIESKLRQDDARWNVDKGSEWYQTETFQRLLRNLYVLDKRKLALFIDDILLQLPKENLLKSYFDELKSLLHTLGYDSKDIDKMQSVKEAQTQTTDTKK